MIVYKRTNGFAHDLRYEQEGYVLKVDDIIHALGFGELPKLETLHDSEAVLAKEQAEAAEEQRKSLIEGDVLATEMFAALKVATPEQISNFVDNKVVDLITAKTMFKRILLVLALIANGRS